MMRFCFSSSRARIIRQPWQINRLESIDPGSVSVRLSGSLNHATHCVSLSVRAHSRLRSSVAPALSEMEIGFGPSEWPSVRRVDNVMDHRGVRACVRAFVRAYTRVCGRACVCE